MIFFLNKEIPLPKGKSLIVFDADCLLCNRAMNALLFLERGDHFRITARKNSRIIEILLLNDTLAKEDSVILISGEMAYTKADAVRQITLHLNFIFFLITALVWITPKPIINSAYHWIASHRGNTTKTNCSLLSKEKYNHKTYS